MAQACSKGGGRGGGGEGRGGEGKGRGRERWRGGQETNAAGRAPSCSELQLVHPIAMNIIMTPGPTAYLQEGGARFAQNWSVVHIHLKLLGSLLCYTASSQLERGTYTQR